MVSRRGDRHSEQDILSPGVEAGVASTEDAGVEEGVFLLEVKKELIPDVTEVEDETEETQGARMQVLRPVAHNARGASLWRSEPKVFLTYRYVCLYLLHLCPH